MLISVTAVSDIKTVIYWLPKAESVTNFTTTVTMTLHNMMSSLRHLPDVGVFISTESQAVDIILQKVVCVCVCVCVC